MIDPETGLIIFVVAGVGSLVTFATYDIATKIGPQLESGDLLPMPPPYPPLPRFVYTKPTVVESIVSEFRG
ncbi:MAG: hypothetical protein ACTSYX_05590 [Candidatus Thorarchaeota archaeon]